MSEIKVSTNSSQRQEYVDTLLAHDGLSHIKEDPKVAYCPISLTQTPEKLKAVLAKRQNILMKDVLTVAGITAYDPGTSPTSPELKRTALPNEIYATDSAKIVGARYFVGHNILASTGYGIEVEKAKFYNRVIVVLMDANIRISRMQPHRAIYLQYSNFEKQAKEFIPVFKLLQKYKVGMGFNGELPVLLGFEKGSDAIVDLEELVYKTFPSLQYKYNGEMPIVKLRAENPELFYENR